MPRLDHLGPSRADMHGPSAPSGPAGLAGPPGTADPDSRRPSRRALLRGATGVGAACAAATALSGIGGSALAARDKTGRRGDRGADAQDRTGRPADSGAGTRAAAEPAEQLVIHVKDAKTGQIDVFRGTSLTRVHDPELAARLVQASRR